MKIVTFSSKGDGIIIPLLFGFIFAVFIVLHVLFLLWVNKASKRTEKKEEPQIKTEEKRIPPPVVLTKEDIIKRLKDILRGEMWEYNEEEGCVYTFSKAFKKMFAVRKFRSGEIALQYMATIPMKEIKIDYSSIAYQWLEENRKAIDQRLSDADGEVKLEEGFLPDKQAWQFIADKLAETFSAEVKDDGIVVK